VTDLSMIVGPSLLLARLVLLTCLAEVTLFELQTVAHWRTTAIVSARSNTWNFTIDNVTFSAPALTLEPLSRQQQPPAYRLMKTHTDASRKLM
jgi:hypothetical protein